MDFNVNELSLSELLDFKKKINSRLEDEFNKVMAFANSWILKTGDVDMVQ